MSQALGEAEEKQPQTTTKISATLASEGASLSHFTSVLRLYHLKRNLQMRGKVGKKEVDEQTVPSVPWASQSCSS